MKIPETLINESGVYIILNLYNGKFYIGGTKSGFRQRAKYHYDDLINNRHSNEYLQRSYNINPKSFIFCVIEKCKNPFQREQYYLDNCDWDNVYNISKDATTPKKFKKGNIPWNKGMKMDREHCDKLSKSAKNRKSTKKGRKKRSEAFRKNAKEVLVYDLDNNLLGSHRCIMDLCELNPNPYKSYMKLKNKKGRNGKSPYFLAYQNVANVCNNRIESYKGLKFKYK